MNEIFAGSAIERGSSAAAARDACRPGWGVPKLANKRLCFWSVICNKLPRGGRPCVLCIGRLSTTIFAPQPSEFIDDLQRVEPSRLSRLPSCQGCHVAAVAVATATVVVFVVAAVLPKISSCNLCAPTPKAITTTTTTLAEAAAAQDDGLKLGLELVPGQLI